MKRFSVPALFIVAAMGAGCYKNPTIAIPPPPPSRLFVSQFNVGALNYFSQPFSAASTPTTIAAIVHPIGIATDSVGNLFVAVGNGFDMFAKPATSTTVPVNTPIAGAGEPYGALVAHNGNLFITDAAVNTLSVFSTPATAPTLVQTTAIPQFNRPEGMSQDLGGDTFIAQEGNGTVVVLAPGFGAAPVPIAVLTLPAGTAPVGLASDSHDNLYVADTNTGNIQVYTPPWATAPRVPAFVIAPPAGLHSVDFLTMDPSGNLYAAYESGGPANVAIYAGPSFSGATTPSLLLPITDAVGVAFAP
ncbi:MAG: hypothetical protein JO347_05015 [Candidatus Eremiobacteraeota bacterium]|nr:hypothetical protein [Candidatus Eremiobacteraeota bacterium]MBV8281408.1 hypothetical protein [Candidatus Eremiobacteraeota bacterium]